jgi:DNA-binding response OmpR family regulator
VRVLLIADKRVTATILQRGLQREGYTVDVAANSRDGLRHAAERDYDAVVLDLATADLNGFWVSEELRRAGNKVLVLMLSHRDKIAGQGSRPLSYPLLLTLLRDLIGDGAA